MGNSDSGVKIDIEAELAGFNSSMARAQAHLVALSQAFGTHGEAVKQANQQMDAAERSANSLGTMIGRLAGALTVGMFTKFLKSCIDAEDQIGKLSQKTGTAIETLAGLKFAAEQSDTSLQSVALAAKHLSSSLADKPELFARFGITAKDSGEALVQLADVFAAMPDGVEKSALAVKLLGRSGEEMIPFLNQGSAAVRSLIEQGKKYNPVTEESARRAAEFNDNLRKLSASAQTLGMNMANDMLDPLTQITKAMSAAAREAGLLQATWVGLGGLGTALFTDDLLSKERQLEHRIQELRTKHEGTFLQRAAQPFLHPIDAVSGAFGDSSTGEIARLQAELDVIRKQREEREKIAASEKQLRKELAANNRDSKGRDLLEALSGNNGDEKDDKPFKPYAYPELTSYLKGINREEEALKRQQWGEHQDWLKGEEKKAQAIEEIERGLYDRRAEVAGEAAKKIADAQQKEAERASKSWENFTGNVQRNLGDVLYDGLQGKFDGIADLFLKMLLRMQADAAAAKLTQWMFPEGGGGLSGLVGGLFGSQPTGLAGMDQSAAIMASDIPGYAKGAAFDGGVTAFARGGIVDRPTVFPFARGIGLMGEAGPEAILPLRRDSSGRLGVSGGGGGGVVVNVIESPSNAGQVQQRDEGGVSIIDVFVASVKSSIASDIARGNGDIPAALSRTYGMNRAAGAY